MYDRILHRIQALVLAGNYTLSHHARDELDRDWQFITLDDIEAAILSGQIIERQWDRRFREWKYVVEGDTVAGNRLRVVVKLVGHVVVITVYLLR